MELDVLARIRSQVASRGGVHFGLQGGATAVEYALVAALIAAVIGGTVLALGARVAVLFSAALAAFP